MHVATHGSTEAARRRFADTQSSWEESRAASWLLSDNRQGRGRPPQLHLSGRVSPDSGTERNV